VGCLGGRLGWGRDVGTLMPGDDVAALTGWRVFGIAIVLIVGTIAGSLFAAMALYGHPYNLTIAAIVFESGLAAVHIFCAGNLGRGYDPFHPLVRAVLPWLLALHLFVITLIFVGGMLASRLATALPASVVTTHGPKHESTLKFMVIVALTSVYITEVMLARRKLAAAVAQSST
jgi:hypothetical protein